jgi:prepilin-type N-terminal cleavage/methylation domain-containing protein
MKRKDGKYKKYLSYSKKLAFTLIELLVVIAIIGILAGIIIVSMSGATDKANIAKSQVFANSVRDTLGANLVSEWRFDSTTSDGSTATTTDVLDTWGTSNGTPSSQPIVKTGSSCVSGSCLQFDGADDYIDFGKSPSLSMGTGDATVSLWVKFDNASSSQSETLIRCGGGDTADSGYWIMRYVGTSQLFCYFTDGTGLRLSANLSPSEFLKSNIWYNIVITFDRDNVAQAYINGSKQIGYSMDISAQKGAVQNAQSFRIGAWAATNSRLSGKMDEIRVYNAIMPTSQIKQQYFAGLQQLLANGEITRKEYDQRIADLEFNISQK